MMAIKMPEISLKTAVMGLSLGALVVGLRTAHADGVRVTEATAARGRAAPGPAPVWRGDGRRTGRATGAPKALSVLWKVSVGDGLDVAPAVDTRSVVAATTSGAVVSLDRSSGRETARAQLPAPVAQSLSLTARGDRIAVTAGGDVMALTASGRVRYRRVLPARANELTTVPLLTAGGGVLLAMGASLLLLDADGDVVDQATLPEATTGALVEGPSGGALAVTETGRVYRWSPPASPALLGSLGGAPTMPAALAGRSLVSVVEGRRLVFFDVGAGAAGVVVTAASTIEAPASVGAGGEVWLTTAGGMTAVDATGAEVEKATLAIGDSLAVPPLALPERRVALVRASGEVVIWSHEGVTTSEGRVCTDPVGLAADAAQVIVSCRDGAVVALGSSGSP